jgi:hypothetical protein
MGMLSSVMVVQSYSDTHKATSGSYHVRANPRAIESVCSWTRKRDGFSYPKGVTYSVGIIFPFENPQAHMMASQTTPNVEWWTYKSLPPLAVQIVLGPTMVGELHSNFGSRH